MTQPWAVEVEAWGMWMRSAGRPATTIEMRVYHLRRFAASFQDVGPWFLTVEQLAEWLGEHDWAPETRRSYRASLRSFYSWGQAVGRRPDSPAALLPTIALPRGVARPAPEAIYRAAMAAAGPRERLMIGLAAACGLRRGEIARARREDVLEDLIGYSLRVRGKGAHVRNVPLPDRIAQEIAELPGGWLFPSRESGHLTEHHVGKLVSRLLPDGWTCHTLRHRCATIAYENTRDLFAVQELLGHAKPETTRRYVKLPADAVRAAMLAAAA